MVHLMLSGYFMLDPADSTGTEAPLAAKLERPGAHISELFIHKLYPGYKMSMIGEGRRTGCYGVLNWTRMPSGS
jgi:hypothetical protein